MGDFMDIIKMPRMEKSEYDELIRKEYICRIAFGGESHPYIAPFLYVFNGKFIYFLSTKYGRKIEQFRRNPFVTVEVEKYSPDLSNFSFVAIPGRLTEVEDQEIKRNVREMFVKLIKTRGLSPNILSALGHSPDEPLEAILAEERSSVWKLVGVNVEEILGLKNSTSK
jgi:nitroimidazol reductase NimA-like FMN-containing flavoprotein (pyridoxamine 5'-phosphate oxidase superfamily)